MSLSPQQHRLLTFLAERLRTTGVCPSTSDMMAALGSRGRGNVHDMVTILEQRGYLRRLFHRRSRCIEIVRLPDDVSENWLRAASSGSIARELARRGFAPQTRSGHGLCPRCGAERPNGGPAVDAGQRRLSPPARARAAPPVAPGRAPAAPSVRGAISRVSADMGASAPADIGASHSFTAATASPRRLRAAT